MPFFADKGRAARLVQGVLLSPCAFMDVEAQARPASCPNVGGQAVIEGVMMRGPSRWTVTVRRTDQSLESTVIPYSGWAKKRPLLGKPFLRGAVVLLESMIVGIKALNYSAEIAAGDEDQAKAQDDGGPAAEKKASAAKVKTKPALGFWALALTLLSAFALAMGLFVALPHVASILLGQVWGFNESSGWFHLIGSVKAIYFWRLAGPSTAFPPDSANAGWSVAILDV